MILVENLVYRSATGWYRSPLEEPGRLSSGPAGRCSQLHLRIAWEPKSQEKNETNENPNRPSLI